jgi:hypothetical protein
MRMLIAIDDGEGVEKVTKRKRLSSAVTPTLDTILHLLG